MPSLSFCFIANQPKKRKIKHGSKHPKAKQSTVEKPQYCCIDLSEMLNIFVLIAHEFFQNRFIDLSQIATYMCVNWKYICVRYKCICLNCRMYLSKWENTFVLRKNYWAGSAQRLDKRQLGGHRAAGSCDGLTADTASSAPPSK